MFARVQRHCQPAVSEAAVIEQLAVDTNRVPCPGGKAHPGPVVNLDYRVTTRRVPVNGDRFVAGEQFRTAA